MQGALQVNIGKTSVKAKCCAGFSCSGVFRSIYYLCFWADEPPCINTRIQHERALNSIAKRVSRGSKPLRGCRAALCWGQGAKPLGFPQSTRGQSIKERSTQSRERVKGGTPLWGQGAKPLGFPQSTRGQSMKERSTQSRERVKGGTPLRSPEAEPLVPPPHSNSCVFMETVKRTLSPSQ